MITAGCFEVVEPVTDGYRRKALLQLGDIFGELSFFDHQPHSTDVRAVDNAEAIVVTSTGFDRLRLRQPQLALRFVLHFGRLVSLRFRRHDLRLTALEEL
jgi:CRP-like cAMP-binding protein